MIRLTNVCKRFSTDTSALSGVDLEIKRGEYVFITGSSGAGKSSLLRLLLRQEVPTEGNVTVNDFDLGSLPRSKVPALRRSIGVVFQDFKLIQRKTALENVAYVLNIAGVSRTEQRRKAYNALRAVSLNHRLHALPTVLSGGEQQRVAIARAVVNEPKLLLADEPTGNLDSSTGVEIMKLFDNLHAQGNTLIVVTHEQHVAEHAMRVVRLSDGDVVSDSDTRDTK